MILLGGIAFCLGFYIGLIWLLAQVVYFFTPEVPR